MVKDEKAVLDYINIVKTATTEDICNHFKYSESTTRRILKVLADRGLIQRYHGGAISNAHKPDRANVVSRFDVNRVEKDRIAKYAASLVVPGSTVCKLCKYLKKKQVTVITNSMLVYEELKDNPYTTLILLGGRLDYDEMEVEGVLTISNLQCLRADRIFRGAHNFDPKIGFTTPNMESVEFYRLCTNAAKAVCLLVDSSKVGTNGAAIMATCDMVDKLITDSSLPDEIAEAFEKNTVRVCRV